MSGRIAADNEAAQDGEEGRTLDEGVAGRQFPQFQMVRKNAVFDRSEQGCDHAKPEQGDIEQGQGGEPEAGGGDQLDAQLGEFQPSRDGRLVVRIGDLAPERRQDQRGRDEEADGERDQRTGLPLAKAEEDQHRQHLADKIVVEG